MYKIKRFLSLILSMILVLSNVIYINAEDMNSIENDTILYQEAETQYIEVEPQATTVGTIYDFPNTDSIQAFVVPQDGTYQLEVWGSSGEFANTGYGGKGGYATGTKYLTQGTTLYVVTGRYQSILKEHDSFNGGGYGSGGGATHIATVTGQLRQLSTKQSSVLIVAGGGGGDGYWSRGGNGGGLTGANTKDQHGAIVPNGGTQTAGGTSYIPYANSGGFGYGGEGDRDANTGGGGGGWYGGASGGGGSVHSGGGGGSSYIGGVENGSTIGGVNVSHGYAKITYIAQPKYTLTVNANLTNTTATIKNGSTIISTQAISGTSGNIEVTTEGSYTLELSKNGYITQSKSFTSTFGSSGSLSYTLVQPTLTITSNQSNTNYSITGSSTYNGTISGTSTTLTIPTGTYNVSLSKTGYTTASTGSFTLSSNTSKTVNLSVNNYTVTYNTNGGSDISTDTVPYGTTYTVKTTTKTGYTLGGFYYDSALINPVGSSLIMGASNIVLYAKWIPIQYNLTVNASVGSVAKIYNNSGTLLSQTTLTSTTQVIQVSTEGNCSLELSKPGYLTQTKAFTSSFGGSGTLNYTLVYPNINITTNVSDTKITFIQSGDVKKVIDVPGTTVVVSDLPTGTYQITVSKDNYLEKSETLVSDEAEENLSFNIYATVKVPVYEIDPENPISAPNRTLTINSNVTGYNFQLISDVTGETAWDIVNVQGLISKYDVLYGGYYTLKAQKTDYRDIEIKSIDINVSNEVDIELYVDIASPVFKIDPLNPIVAPKNYITINSNTTGYDLTLTHDEDGYIVSKTIISKSEQVEVPKQGTYTLVAEKYGYKTLTLEDVVVSSAENIVDVNLLVDPGLPIYNIDKDNPISAYKNYLTINSNVEDYILIIQNQDEPSYLYGKPNASAIEEFELPKQGLYDVIARKDNYIEVVDEIYVTSGVNVYDVELYVETKSPLEDIVVGEDSQITAPKRMLYIYSNKKDYNVEILNQDNEVIFNESSRDFYCEIPIIYSGYYKINVSKTDFETFSTELQINTSTNVVVNLKEKTQVIETENDTNNDNDIDVNIDTQEDEKDINTDSSLEDEFINFDTTEDNEDFDIETPKEDLTELSYDEISDKISNSELTGDDLDMLLEGGYITFSEYVSLIGKMVGNELKFSQFKIPIGSSVYKIDYQDYSVEYDSLVINYVNTSTQATMLCLRALINASGTGKMYWEKELLRTDLIFEKRKVNVSFIEGSNVMLINGREIEMVNANGVKLNTEVTSGRTMVPFRYISEFMNFEVEYDKTGNKAVAINQNHKAS